ncbi:MAG: 16S rRNA (cytosine(1402)-N(4))-methyltransferase RsmH [Patescibacteria group bacterium]|nr:16S rRNA (cytosine(1402)-N(4))-methyltransferase RsmH [Patescibacteria group bacterium]
MMDTYEHTPVLLHEVIGFLDPQPGQNLVDATLGGGGYSRQILRHIGPAGKLLSIDLDLDAIKFAEDQKSKNKNQNWILAHGNFAQIDKHVKRYDFADISGIVADLGLSSYELENRGISFQSREPLDMRFDQTQNVKDARLVVNDYTAAELIKIFENYGEEPYSKQIARKILEIRGKRQIYYTTELYQVIVEALPKPLKHKADDHARRVFQALRIEVNQELQSLEEFLPKALDLLSPGGRLVIVSFHSLEDRMVKQFFAGMARGCICPSEFPQCVCGKSPRAKILTKKPITASVEELAANPRAKPAKLRAVQKI